MEIKKKTLTILSFPADFSESLGGQRNYNSPCQYRTSIICSWMQSSEETQEFHFHLLNTTISFLSNSGLHGTQHAPVLLLRLNTFEGHSTAETIDCNFETQN